MEAREKVSFIADLNVGRLAKWLRVIGYDTVFIPELDDADLVLRAMEEQRVLLTKDARLMERRLIATGKAKGLLVRGDKVQEQLRFVVERLELSPSGHLFSRCIECNTPLEKVPPFVYQTQEEFALCVKCGKIYWQGTHWRNMRAELERITV